MEHKELKLQTTNYLPSTEAAQRFGLTNDHIASLCRRKKVEGVLRQGRVWFVNEESLKTYLIQAAEDKAARHRALSEAIRREQEVAQPKHAEVSFLPHHAYALLLPLLLAVAVNSTPALNTALASAHYSLGAAVAQYEQVLDIAVELQVDAYQTVGEAITAAASQPARIPIAQSTRFEIGTVGESALDAQLARIPAQVAAATAGHTFETFELLPLVPVPSSSADLSWMPYFPETLADNFVQAWELVFVGGAQHFVAGVAAAGDLQEAAYASAIDFMYDLADDVSAAVVLSVQDVSYSANAAAVWYIESSQTVQARTELR